MLSRVRSNAEFCLANSYSAEINSSISKPEDAESQGAEAWPNQNQWSWSKINQVPILLKHIGRKRHSSRSLQFLNVARFPRLETGAERLPLDCESIIDDRDAEAVVIAAKDPSILEVIAGDRTDQYGD